MSFEDARDKSRVAQVLTAFAPKLARDEIGALELAERQIVWVQAVEEHVFA